MDSSNSTSPQSDQLSQQLPEQLSQSSNTPTPLNAPQLEAVTHVSGPMLVLAGAGSGKTRVITYRIAHLLTMHRVAPYRIYAVTFTNKAAREMRSRIEQLVGPELTRDLWMGTFHATCARILRRYHENVGLGKDFVIYDDSDQRAVMSRALDNLGIDDARFPPKHALSLLHDFKQHGLPLDQYPVNSPVDQILVNVLTEYQRLMIASNAVDFDDIIIYVVNLAEDGASLAGSELQRRFDHILVDEFQDVNPVQYRLIRALATDHRSVCVVGDDDQSIYRWRGADVRIIRGFARDFPGTRVVKLEQNYRSSSNVVRAALAVIKPSAEREPKELFTTNPPGNLIEVIEARNEHEEASFVAQSICGAVGAGTPRSQIAVFYRVHAQSRVLEDKLRGVNIPYQIIGGTRFYDRKEIKDLLSYLRVLINPASDVDLLRIINTPARQIGKTTVDQLVETATASRHSVYDVVTKQLNTTGLSPASRKRVAAFAFMMETLRGRLNELGPRAVAEEVLNATGYEKSLEDDDTAESDSRIENLHELLGSITEYEDEMLRTGQTPSLAGYLQHISLVSSVDEMQDTERVSLMTVHAAKGLEFDTVFITGFEDGLFPYQHKR